MALPFFDIGIYIYHIYICICVCVCDEILLSHKTNEIMPFSATLMDLETIIIGEISQKDKHHMISLICGI